EPSGGRHALVDSVEEFVVELLVLLAARMRLLQLFDHAGALLFRVVELGKGVAQFPCITIGLEAFDEARFARYFLGEGRDVLREMRDMAWLDKGRFDLLLEDEGEAFAPGPVLLRLEAGRLGRGAGFLVGPDGEEVDAGHLL